MSEAEAEIALLLRFRLPPRPQVMPPHLTASTVSTRITTMEPTTATMTVMTALLLSSGDETTVSGAGVVLLVLLVNQMQICLGLEGCEVCHAHFA